MGIVVMKRGATDEQINNIVEFLKTIGIEGYVVPGLTRQAINLIGDTSHIDRERFESMSGVESVKWILPSYQLSSREYNPRDKIVDVNGIRIGKNSGLVVMSGPCSIESYEQLKRIAEEDKKSGAKILRGGAYKPRKDRLTFRGLKEEGLKILEAVRAETRLPVVTELEYPTELDLFVKYGIDIIQIGNANAKNHRLIEEAAKTKKPILLKRGESSTIEEWLLCADYALAQGNENIILCERGIRTFEPYTRNTFDVSAIAAAKLLSYLPVIGDPSHGTGLRELVYSMSKAAVVAGADGLLIETHYNPDNAWSDSKQTIPTIELKRLIRACNKIYSLDRRYG